MEQVGIIGNCRGVRYVGAALQEVRENIDQRIDSEHPPKHSGLGTGFNDLDGLTLGFRPGSLIVIASRPSVGKSTFALNIATHVSMNEKQNVLMFCPETAPVLIATRLLSRFSKIALSKLNACTLTEDEQNQFNGAMDVLNNVPLLIDETPVLDVETIILQARSAISRNTKLGLIIIDHLQLVEPLCSSDATSENYENVLFELKEFAREVNIPVVVLSQFNRNLELRRDKRPLLNDLPDRMVWHYSDLLLFLYRDDFYNPDSDGKGMMEVHIARNRFGEKGGIGLGTDELKFFEFSNM